MRERFLLIPPRSPRSSESLNKVEKLLTNLQTPQQRADLHKMQLPDGLDLLCSYAGALAVIGGKDCLLTLQRWRAELDSNDNDQRAYCLAAEAFIDQDSDDAAKQLVKDFFKPITRSPSLCIRLATEIAVRTAAKTNGLILIRGALEPLIDTSDDLVFMHSARYLVDIFPHQTAMRCEAILESETNAGHRGFILSLLNRSPEPAKAIAIQLRWLKRETDIQSALGLAAYLAPLLDDQFKEQLLTKAFDNESPICRIQATKNANMVSPTIALDLLRKAISEEPDELVRAFMIERSSVVGFASQTIPIP
jgi:hypothetical protein